MEVDELRTAWQAQDNALSGMRAFSDHLALAVRSSSATTALERLTRSLALEAAVGAVVVVVLGAFVGDRLAHIGTVVAGALLGAYMIGLLVAVVREIVLVRSIDPAGPVLAIQLQLAEARSLRVRVALAALALGPLMWSALAVVLADAATGSDFALGAPYLIANMGFGLAVLGAAVWASRRFGQRLAAASRVRGIADTLAGTAMRSANDSIASLRDFEYEDPGEAA